VAILCRLRSLWRNVVHGERVERELGEELNATLEHLVDEKIRAGRTPDLARREARLALDGIEPVKEHVRQARAGAGLDTLWQDGRYALRVLRRSPSFTLAAVATLALGIGGTTAVFSVVDATLIRPLPYRDPERLVAIQETNADGSRIPVNALHFREWKRNVQAFEAISLIRQVDMNLTGVGEPELVSAARVSAGFFHLLGVQPSLGRSFVDDEDQLGRDRVVVISDALWRRKFNGDPSLVGRRIMLEGQPYEVVGVMPPSFRFPRLTNLYAAGMAGAQPEIWKPFAASRQELTVAGYFSFASIGRLRADVTAEQARAALNIIQQRIGAQVPGYNLGAAVIPLQDQVMRRSRAGLRLLLAAVSVVLLIACVNITNLLFVRSAARGREVAVRVAVGATRTRLIRQMLIESLALSAIGGAAGIALAYGLVPVIARNAPPEVPQLHDMALDPRVLVFAIALSVLTGISVGLLPAWRFASRRSSSPASALRTQRSSGGFRASLVGIEVAGTAVCLVICALLLNSFDRLMAVDPGFAVERVMTIEVRLPAQRYADVTARGTFIRTVIDRLGSLPGVTAAAASNGTPLTGTGAINGVIIEGSTAPRGQRPDADTRQATPAYFAATGTPLKEGRFFSDADGRRPVAVVSSTAAAELWPGQSAIGKRFSLSEGPLFEVVGVVGDIRTDGLDQPARPTIYLPTTLGFAGTRVAFYVRTSGEERPWAAMIAQALRAADAELAIPIVRTMADVVDESVAQRRFQLLLVSLFAVLATFLASIGIYGVVAQAVAQRTNEFGIRLALGARASHIRALVFRQGAVPIVVGLAVGVLMSLASSRFIASLLFDVKPTDVLTLASVAGVIALVSLVAMHLPARRATRVDPMIALRVD
jgi:predicted permease